MERYTFKNYIKSFTNIEKAIATILLYCMAASIALFGHGYYKENTVLVNIPGGTFVEGSVGTVSYIDPVNASNTLEKEISQLIFRGLVRFNPAKQEFESDLAQNWTVSPDGLTYTFTLQQNQLFHNGQAITIDDVVGTYQLLHQKPYSDMQIEKISSTKITFTIPKADSFFLRHFNVGIVPASFLSQQGDVMEILQGEVFSRRPIGSGMFEVKQVRNEASQTVIVLEPKIKAQVNKLELHIFKSEEDLIRNTKFLSAVRSVGPAQRDVLASEGWEFHTLHVPKYAVLFFDNVTDGPTAADKFRLAMKYAINKQSLVERVPFTEVMNFPVDAFDSQTIAYDKSVAASLFYEEGWGVYDDDPEELRRNKDRVPLVLDIITSQNEDFLRTARELKRQFEELGITINIRSLPLSQIQSEVLTSRNYQMLLLGQDLGLDEDFRSYLHSTQSNAPGLNLSQYKSPEADVLLSKIAESYDKNQRLDYLKQLQDLINQEVPMVFLYRTFEVYATAPTARVVLPEKVGAAGYRFLTFPEWMIKIKRIPKKD